MVGVSGWRKAAVVSVFLAPSLVALLAFSIGPMIGTFWVSLQEWNLIRPARFTKICARCSRLRSTFSGEGVL